MTVSDLRLPLVLDAAAVSSFVPGLSVSAWANPSDQRFDMARDLLSIGRSVEVRRGDGST